MYTSNEHYAHYHNCLYVNNSEPGQSILDLISCKPFQVNIHCHNDSVVYGQIINRLSTDQQLLFRKAIDFNVIELSLTAIRYIALSVPVLPFKNQFVEQKQHTGYRVVLNDNTALTGIARTIFKDRDSVNIWQMNPGHTIKHLLIPYQGIQAQQYSPSI